MLPKIALQYNFDKGNNIYVSATKGYRSGGYNIQMFSDLLQNDMQSSMMKDVADVTIPVINNVPMIGDDIKQKVIGILEGMSASGETDIQATTLYKPEYSWNYEIGSHLTLFNGKLQTDLALFYMSTRDQQLSRFAESGLGRITVNAEEQKPGR